MSNNKGIPTIGVRGIQYRSRIEAQYAYIFEKLGWDWEYEPIDLEGYIPDFIIKFGGEEFLIEIKGDTNIWKEEVYKPHIDKILQSGWKGQFGILGSVYKKSYDYTGYLRINIGKLYQNKWEVHEPATPALENAFHIDDLIIVYCNQVEKFYVDGLNRKEIFDSSFDRHETYNYIAHAFQNLWADAKNNVQWKGKQNTQQIKDKPLDIHIFKKRSYNDDGTLINNKACDCCDYILYLNEDDVDNLKSKLQK
jgi:hypothetical protein